MLTQNALRHQLEFLPDESATKTIKEPLKSTILKVEGVHAVEQTSDLDDEGKVFIVIPAHRRAYGCNRLDQIFQWFYVEHPQIAESCLHEMHPVPKGVEKLRRNDRIVELTKSLDDDLSDVSDSSDVYAPPSKAGQPSSLLTFDPRPEAKQQSNTSRRTPWAPPINNPPSVRTTTTAASTATRSIPRGAAPIGTMASQVNTSYALKEIEASLVDFTKQADKSTAEAFTKQIQEVTKQTVAQNQATNERITMLETTIQAHKLETANKVDAILQRLGPVPMARSPSPSSFAAAMDTGRNKPKSDHPAPILDEGSLPRTKRTDNRDTPNRAEPGSVWNTVGKGGKHGGAPARTNAAQQE